MLKNFNRIKRVLIFESGIIFCCLLAMTYFSPLNYNSNNLSNLIHYISPSNDNFPQHFFNFELFKLIIVFVFIPLNVLMILNELKSNIINSSTVIVALISLTLGSILIRNLSYEINYHTERHIADYLQKQCYLNDGCRNIPNKNSTTNNSILALSSVAAQIRNKLIHVDKINKINYKLIKSAFNTNNDTMINNYEISNIEDNIYPIIIYNTFKNPSSEILSVNKNDKINFYVYKKDGFCSLYIDSIEIKNNKNIKFINILQKLEQENNMSNLLNKNQYEYVNKGLLTKTVLCENFNI